MRAYIYAFIISATVAVLFGTGWYALFGYDPFKSAFTNISDIYTNIAFWRGVGIWTILYALFFAFPIVFVRNRKIKEEN
jgi:hypothetical protein